jgi:hypothetical protein
MKYIITESKLNDLRTDYLNNSIGSDHYFEEFIILNYPFREDDDENEVMMEYDHEDGRLYVDSSFGKYFSDLFFPNEEEAYEYITKWFEWKYGVNVEYSQS